MPQKVVYTEDDPFWYKDAIIYELHVKAFSDFNDDGIGDFKGLTDKLDYLEHLGITAIWLLPFYPSPLKDDGYDIANYFGVHPDYGLLRDFKEFVKESHKRGIRVITELVLNHTSERHVWFQGARKAKPGSALRNFYVWSSTSERYQDARIIFKDFESSNWTWDPVAKSHYWHRFYAHQPDLNFDNLLVQKKILRVIDYWLDMGVDGFRLDAVPYLFEREGTNCENLPETHGFLKKLRAHVDSAFKNKMLLAEANQWPEDAIAYFGNGDECHMSFHFPLMPRLFMAIWMEDRFPIIDIFEQTPSIPDACQWALFLRNHDELTLEMVSDEERDYMYRVYARDPVARINLGIRRRLAPLLGNNRRKIELMNALLFSLPGTPIIYYGDEIGMGDNYHLGDRNGVRTPMQWNVDRNAGFSRANPQKLFLPIIMDPEYHYEAVNVENQERNQASLLWWMRRVIAMRKRFKAFGRGSIEFLFSDNPKVLAFIRQYQNEIILTVVNLSRFSQVVKLDLSRFSGYWPEEVFSRNKFPRITEAPYTFTIGRHDYYWFALQKTDDGVRFGKIRTIPELSVSGSWELVFEGKTRETLEREILPPYIKMCRWFGGKAQEMQGIKIIETISLREDSCVTQLLLIEVRYITELSDTYLLPLSFSSGDKAENIVIENFPAVVAHLKTESAEGIIYDSIYNEEFRKHLLRMFARKHTVHGFNGYLVTYTGKTFKKYKLKEILLEKSEVLKTEQSNSSFLYGKELFLKLYRRLDEGINPDLEIGKFLTENTSFSHIPSFAGAIEYRRHSAEPVVIGMLQAFIPNQGDAWTYTLDWVGRYLGRVLAKRTEIQEMPTAPSSLLEIAFQEIPLLFQELIGGVYIEMITLLGKRTAELHLSLSSETEDPDFRPEPFSVLYQRSLYQSMQLLTKKVFALIRKNVNNLPDNLKELMNEILNFEKEIMSRFSVLFKRKLSAMKIRIHGDYHLGQVLHTGNDFVIIDFEGEPARTLTERRLKRSPLRDVASMIRSFHYAAHTALLKHASVRPEDIPALEPWLNLWYRYVGGAFLRSYLNTAGNAPFIPRDKEDLSVMLRAYLLEKAVYELGYELNNRPEWVIIPLKGIKHLLEVR
ncbi:MAG: maltose alpha-D-glucosyltransferase [Candidatus Brocadia sp. AMX2]|uniref:Maltokinase n=1 Tax=Candidatus Brocadia sinica JPN1 TaxID=1197129 RepID=A0ABQ0JSB3_9BACT|nr:MULTISPECIES: maltose alpha-D-glucosyltransferase [Brocadia]KXK29056.1 MAG: trehalose synthase [Candidatus Brocadia sinica]MBC6933133.1 maltose alpha-D-glucosyltransferase [Candidatus Brocadia sp.]MBL1168387.1 maltose alpha-D-glucosyltransferase [Candidatus Brocadia sp. AMX1]MCE7867440.1 maltose alpha-D-glucosyltransferase [Candidatus Brocadia sp. AMX2]MCK6468427.1 maltose alpha-D-glucosyltransferase [Candidatus Brocadia sinica]